MEYVDGTTLADILRTEQKLPAARAARGRPPRSPPRSASPTRNGVVHRDVKPGNILVTDNGDVKVADFGIARARTPARRRAHAGRFGDGDRHLLLARAGAGRQPDPRSDLYSLGIVMYEMVGGRPPFNGENPVSIAYKQVHEAPPRLLDLTPDVPVAYEAIVAKLLAKNPAQRYATADDLRLDLTRFRDGQRPEALAHAAAAAPRSRQPPPTVTPPVPSTYGQPTTVVAASPGTQVLPAAVRATRRRYADRRRPTRSPRRTGWLWAGIVLALLVLAVGGFLLFQALNEDEPNTPTTITMPDLINVPLDEATADLPTSGSGTITRQPRPTTPLPRTSCLRAGSGGRATVRSTARGHACVQPAPRRRSTWATSSAAQSADGTAASTRPRVTTRSPRWSPSRPTAACWTRTRRRDR